MQVILRHSFPLGRFHATPWRVSTFDDPYGEWPPSPFRLVRAIVARFYQLTREHGGSLDALDGLVRALAGSTVRYHLPPVAWRGPSVRQYLPDVGLAWSPPGKKDQAKGAMKVSERFLAQDNCFAVSPDEPLYWFLAGQDWTVERLSLLDACLARMTYFGRAESITSIERVPEAPSAIVVNCELVDRRDRGAVPVLCVNGDMTAAIASDETALRSATVPPGAIWRYAVRPARPAARRLPIRRTHKSTSLIQFAIGATVQPPLSAITTITGRLRGRVLREAFTELNDGVVTSWREAHPDLRARVADLAGKDAAGEPLKGHSHARYLLWCDGDGRATRLLVHRVRAFEPWEHDAILRAAQLPLGWSQGKSEGWTLRLVPMDSAVPPPAGFDGARSRWWTSVSPFVPGRHFLDSRGRLKEGESPREQINNELAHRGWPQAEVSSLSDAGWVRVHAPQRQRGGATNNARRSFRMTLQFAEPVAGPVFLGHSSFFGLGLFAPHEVTQ